MYDFVKVDLWQCYFEIFQPSNRLFESLFTNTVFDIITKSMCVRLMRFGNKMSSLILVERVNCCILLCLR